MPAVRPPKELLLQETEPPGLRNCSYVWQALIDATIDATFSFRGSPSAPFHRLMSSTWCGAEAVLNLTANFDLALGHLIPGFALFSLIRTKSTGGNLQWTTVRTKEPNPGPTKRWSPSGPNWTTVHFLGWKHLFKCATKIWMKMKKALSHLRFIGLSLVFGNKTVLVDENQSFILIVLNDFADFCMDQNLHLEPWVTLSSQPLLLSQFT